MAKFKEGQVVYWGNGKNQYVRIYYVNSLHCVGACQSYRVHQASKSLAEFSGKGSIGEVSEEVLRSLSLEEIGLGD